MTALNDMIRRAKSAPKHIVLAEGEDPRIVKASVRAVKDGIAQITLLGNKKKILDLMRFNEGDKGKIAIVDPGQQDAKFKKPLNYANHMVQTGLADGSLAGATHKTSEVILSAIRVIGSENPREGLSSLFVMIFPEDGPYLKGPVIFSDCALIVTPTIEQLAIIAMNSAESARTLLKINPKIAMLSFATRQSAMHEFVDKVQKATHIIRTTHPNIPIEGPTQFDAAISADIASVKSPGSDLRGDANVFVFPNLDAGNIGYKMAERLGGAKAIGPILQGLRKPANDLSRGCSADDVYNMIAVTVLQAQAQNMVH
jgi:phosphate acetyltransferase